MASSHDENLGPLLQQVAWGWTGTAIFILGLRCYTRIKFKGYLSLDDYIMILAMALGIACAVLTTEIVQAGFGQHIQYLSPAQISRSIYLVYITQPLAVWALVFGRVSFAVTLMQVVEANSFRRRFLMALITMQGVVATIYTGLEYGQCNPPRHYWDRSSPGTCIDMHILVNYGCFQAVCNITTNLILAILPVFIASTLNMKTLLKLGLIVLMGLGVFNTGAAIVTIVEAFKVSADHDITYNFVIVDLWGTVQIHLAIIVASIAFLRPLFRGFQPPAYRRSLAGLISSRTAVASSNYENPTDGTFGSREKRYSIHRKDSSPVAPLLPAAHFNHIRSDTRCCSPNALNGHRWDLESNSEPEKGSPTDFAASWYGGFWPGSEFDDRTASQRWKIEIWKTMPPVLDGRPF